ncbi:hypothetical protein ACFL34_05170 [Candidatus Sumerlaeota bacterium]
MSYLSKQRIDRILGRCFERSWLGVKQGEPRLVRIAHNVTVVTYRQAEAPVRVRNEEVVHRVLAGIARRENELPVLGSSESRAGFL